MVNCDGCCIIVLIYCLCLFVCLCSTRLCWFVDERQQCWPYQLTSVWSCSTDTGLCACSIDHTWLIINLLLFLFFVHLSLSTVCLGYRHHHQFITRKAAQSKYSKHRWVIDECCKTPMNMSKYAAVFSLRMIKPRNQLLIHSFCTSAVFKQGWSWLLIDMHIIKLLDVITLSISTVVGVVQLYCSIWE